MSYTPAKLADETEFYGFDYSQLLAAGETITDATFSITVLEGTDADADDMLSGSAVINGSIVTILLTGGVENVHYNLHCAAETSAGQTMSLSEDFWVRDPDYGLV